MSGRIHAIHVVPHIHDEASGPSYTVPRLCESLASRGMRVGLMCLAAGPSPRGVELEVFAQWARPARFAVSPALARSLHSKASTADLIHNHSLWSMSNVAAGWAVPGHRAKLVVSPHGTLSAWALGHSGLVKRTVWPLQRRLLARADLLHATSQTECEEIRALGFRAPVAVIANGVDLPELAPVEAQDDVRTLLFLSRIHPKKGIDVLLHAWAGLQARYPRWRLVIAGRGDPAHEAQVRALMESLRLQRVEFPGPLFGAAKLHAYASADLFVLPTHSENFGMVVAEALAHGCPAVVSRGAPWRGLETQECGWWVDLADSGALEQTLAAAMALPAAQRRAMGARGRAWMEQEFSWPVLAARMEAAYGWVLGSGPCPDFVSLVA